MTWNIKHPLLSIVFVLFLFILAPHSRADGPSRCSMEFYRPVYRKAVISAYLDGSIARTLLKQVLVGEDIYTPGLPSNKIKDRMVDLIQVADRMGNMGKPIQPAVRRQINKLKDAYLVEIFRLIFEEVEGVESTRELDLPKSINVLEDTLYLKNRRKYISFLMFKSRLMIMRDAKEKSQLIESYFNELIWFGVAHVLTKMQSDDFVDAGLTYYWLITHKLGRVLEEIPDSRNRYYLQKQIMSKFSRAFEMTFFSSLPFIKTIAKTNSQNIPKVNFEEFFGRQLAISFFRDEMESLSNFDQYAAIVQKQSLEILSQVRAPLNRKDKNSVVEFKSALNYLIKPIDKKILEKELDAKSISTLTSLRAFVWSRFFRHNVYSMVFSVDKDDPRYLDAINQLTHWETDIITAYEMRSMSQVLVQYFQGLQKYDLSDRSNFQEILLNREFFFILTYLSMNPWMVHDVDVKKEFARLPVELINYIQTIIGDYGLVTSLVH